MSSPVKVSFGPGSATGSPLSSAVISYGPQLYVSGQLGRCPVSGQLVTVSVEAQAQQAFANFQAIVQAAGGSLDDVVKVNLYLSDMKHYAMVNTVMRQFFRPPYPARSAVCVASLNGALLEIDGIVQLAK